MVGTMLLIFLVLLVLGMPIAFSMSFSSIFTFLVNGNATLQLAGQQVFNATDNLSLIAVPFFMLAGSVMNCGGVSRRLIRFCRLIFGRLPGGLGIVTVFAAMIFAAISGSGPATVAALGVFMIPSMIDDGYDPGFASALMANSGGLGIIIPPSIPLVMYATLAGCSVGTLFIAGIVPGILIGLAFMVYTFFVAKKNHYKPAPVDAPDFKSKLKIILDAIPALLMPAIILGGIYSGFFTPTEASGVAVFYGLILGVFVYKEIKLKDIKKMFIDAGVMSASAMMVVSLASGFSWIISITRLPRTLSTFLLGVFSNPVLIILMLMVLLLIIGCFMSVSAATVVLTPILVPVMAAMGVSPIVLGITMTVIVSCGMSTPPFAVNLFVASGISKVPIDRMAKYAFILVGITVLMMLIMTFIPGIITFLPRLAGMTV